MDYNDHMSIMIDVSHTNTTISQIITSVRQRFLLHDTRAGFFCHALGLLMCVPNYKNLLICIPIIHNSTTAIVKIKGKLCLLFCNKCTVIGKLMHIIIDIENNVVELICKNNDVLVNFIS